MHKKNQLNLVDEFTNILSSSKEEDTHQFLAKNEWILKDAFGTRFIVNECFSKFRLGNSYITDFLIVSGQSGYYEITLIELEPPTAKPFKNNGAYALRLNQANKQINEWLTWCENYNQLLRDSISKQMKSKYGAEQIKNNSKRIFIKSKIIIGRRSMLSEDDNNMRNVILSQTNQRLEILPYDRLLDLFENRDLTKS